jgi:hypothetical protein
MSLASEYEGNNDRVNPQVMTLINSMPLYWSTKIQNNIFDTAQDGLLMDLSMGLDHQVIVNVPFSMPVIHTTSRVTIQSSTKNNWSNNMLTMLLHHVWKDLLHHLWHYNDNYSNKSWYASSPFKSRLYWESFQGSLSFIVTRMFDKFIIPVLVIMTIMSQVHDQQSTPVHSMKPSANASTRIDVMETVLFMHPDLPVWQGMHSVSNNKSKLLLDMNDHHHSFPELAKVQAKFLAMIQRNEHRLARIAMVQYAHDNKLRCSQPSNSPRQDHIIQKYQVVVPVLDHVVDRTDEYGLLTGSDAFVQHKDGLLSSSPYEMNHDAAKHDVCQHQRMITQANINTSNVTTIMYRGLFTGRPPGLSLLHVPYHGSLPSSISLTLDLHDRSFLTTDSIYPKWHHPSSGMSSKAGTTKKSYPILLICRHCHHRCQGIFKLRHSRRPISQRIRTQYFDCSSCIVAQATTRRLTEQAEHRRRQQIDDEQPRIHVIPDPDLEARIKVEEVEEEQEEPEIGIPISLVLYDHPS